MEHDAEGGSGGQVQEAELGRGVPGDAETARDLADEVRHQVGPVRPFLLSADGHRIDGVRRPNPQAHGGFGKQGPPAPPRLCHHPVRPSQGDARRLTNYDASEFATILVLVIWPNVQCFKYRCLPRGTARATACLGIS